MSTATLDDFMALNDQIAALVQADVPIDLDLGHSKARTLEMLTKINATIARRVGQGMTLSEALDVEDEVISPTYRSVMRLSLSSRDLSAGLREAGRTAEAADEVWRAVRFSGVYPFILCALAYLGLIGISQFLTPRLVNLYGELRLQPSIGLSFLQLLHRTLPVWSILVPIVLIAFGLLLRMRSKRLAAGARSSALLGWLPGASRAVFKQRCANFSQTLASLLNAGTPLNEALAIAAGAWQSRTLEQQFRSLADGVTDGQLPPAPRDLASRLPPFLQWAVWRSEPAIGRPRALAMAAHLYQDAAENRLTRLQIVAPVVACALIGGGVTLFYALVLFVPVIQMLKQLAS